MKTLFDFFTALIFVMAFLPFMILIAAVIVCTDGLPVLFVQQRVGKGGRLFGLFKFRTMTVHQEAARGSFDAGNSSRVTTVGKILRKTKLDELPQLFNVLRGQMSIVGPRPEVQSWTAVYPERWAKVLTVKPGITDNASIVFRNEEEILRAASDPQKKYRDDILPQKLTLYERYVDSHTVLGDIKIVFLTIFAVAKG